MSGCNKPIEVNGRYFSCGQCMSCRISRSREWSTRLIFELTSWNYDACFITLTYDNEHLPSDYGLHKEDLQKFFKRLRKDLSLENRKIKYFSCGEYGDELGRPHYHAIVFGLRFDEHDRQLIKDNWSFCLPERFEGNKNGFQMVHSNNINYVTGYIRKKLNGQRAIEEYGSRQAPFQLVSHGIGLEMAQELKDRMSKTGYITRNGVKMSIPRYFIKKLELNTKTTERRSELVEKRLQVLIEHGWKREDFYGLVQAPYDAIDNEYFKLKEKNLLQNEKNMQRKLELNRSKNKL